MGWTAIHGTKAIRESRGFWLKCERTSVHIGGLGVLGGPVVVVVVVVVVAAVEASNAMKLRRLAAATKVNAMGVRRSDKDLFWKKVGYQLIVNSCQLYKKKQNARNLELLLLHPSCAIFFQGLSTCEAFAISPQLVPSCPMF